MCGVCVSFYPASCYRVVPWVRKFTAIPNALILSSETIDFLQAVILSTYGTTALSIHNRWPCMDKKNTRIMPTHQLAPSPNAL